MSERLTPEQRFDAWLESLADHDEVPVDERTAYIETMRRSSIAKQALLGFTVREFGFQFAEGIRVGMARLSKAVR